MTVCPVATKNVRIAPFFLNRFANLVSEATEIFQTIVSAFRQLITMLSFLEILQATTACPAATKNVRIAPLFLHRFANHV
jgi:hypothetical protein